jgi:chromate transport protein ChrA
MVAPWTVIAMVLPSMLALSGLAALAAEAARNPWLGLLAAGAWAVASIAVMEYAVAPLPLQVLFYADAYATSGTTWVNSGVTLMMAALLWAGAAWVMERHRAEGRDAA